jgi:hypothetical protein
MITIGLCAILIGLGVDFGMMLYSIYELERIDGQSHEAAIATSAAQPGSQRHLWRAHFGGRIFQSRLQRLPRLRATRCAHLLWHPLRERADDDALFCPHQRSFSSTEKRSLRAGSERFLGWIFAAPRRVWMRPRLLSCS